jgi:magnesium-transporting ATPase (P-type)
MGTLITYGRGRGIVVATGMHTQMGLIAEMLQTLEAEPTPLQQRLDQLGRQLGYGALGICGVVFLVALAVGFLAMALRETPAKRIAEAAQKVLFDGLLPGFFNSSMALLAFYLVSSAYRAFRVNSLDSGLMMGSAVIVLLAQVPLGDWITYALPDALQLRSFAQWILLVPNTAVQRAVLIGACGGAFAAGMRQWLGIGRRGTG